jgi:hypothetical protein
MNGGRIVCAVAAASLAAGLAAFAAVPPHEIEVTAVPVLGWGPGVAVIYGTAWGERTEAIAGLGYNFYDIALDFTDDDSESHGFARAAFGLRFYSGQLRGFYLQPEVGLHLNFYELYYHGEPRGFRDYRDFSAVPAFLVGGRWVVADALSLRVGGGAGLQVPWDFGNNGTLPVFARLDICVGYAF